ncbi:Bug family tripartite tricarboxylate transporter substrate binding protein [Halomonas sp. V046]|uniref:Bug family tripartite tricarboxylate transporter substrate binding protein n=1 Tax=Halomonas sp. V046 TaxID=3459611 RepID=UPI0040444835
MKHNKIISIIFSSTIAASASAFSLSAVADSYPEHDIRMVIPYGAGGPTDIIFRQIAREAEKELGVSIIPVNMSGAGATLGSRNVKDAEPDGYTILGGHDNIALSYIAGMVDYSYDAFAPVARVTQTFNMPTTYPAHPVMDASEIPQYIEDHPGEVKFSMIPTSTDHFFWMQMFDAMGIDVADVKLISYPDTTEQMSALMAEEIDFTITNAACCSSFYADGTFRPLGVAHSERLSGEALQDIKTFQEMGVDMESATSRGIFAPAGTPQERIDILADAFETALQNADLREKLITELGSEPSFLAGQAYQDFLQENQHSLEKVAENIAF